MMNLNINFLNESATVEQVKNLHVAINHEGTEMSIQLCKDDISRTEKQISNLEKAESKTEDQKEKEREALNAKLDDLKEALEKLKTDAAETLPVYTQVVTEMSVKNENHFGNDKDVVRTVLRILATWDNSKLIKYAIIPAFQSPELYNALEAIHVSSKASDDGALYNQYPFLSRSAFIKFLIYSALFTLFSEIYLSNLSNSDNSFGV